MASMPPIDSGQSSSRKEHGRDLLFTHLDFQCVDAIFDDVNVSKNAHRGS